MEPKIVSLSAIKLAGYIINTTSRDDENLKAIPKFWADYVSDGRMEKLHGESFIKSHTEYGACFPENPATGDFEYIIGVEVRDADARGIDAGEVPPAYRIREVPAAVYAVFSSHPADGAGFPAAIQGMWRCIFAEWLPGAAYQIDPNGVNFELYDERCMSENDKVCDIYIPILKRI
jgi:AraC family transcriptional regulator